MFCCTEDLQAGLLLHGSNPIQVTHVSLCECRCSFWPRLSTPPQTVSSELPQHHMNLHVVCSLLLGLHSFGDIKGPSAWAGFGQVDETWRVKSAESVISMLFKRR